MQFLILYKCKLPYKASHCIGKVYVIMGPYTHADIVSVDGNIIFSGTIHECEDYWDEHVEVKRVEPSKLGGLIKSKEFYIHGIQVKSSFANYRYSL